MKKRLDVSQKFKTFEGKVIKETPEKDSGDLTLKRVVLTYLKLAGKMGLSDAQQMTAYELGFKVGAGKGDVILTTGEYDALKKVVDSGKVKEPNGTTNEIFNLEVRIQAKKMVDSAEVIKEKKDGNDKKEKVQ